jgi:hypothetical protein
MIYVNGVTNEGDFAVSVWGPDNKPKTLTLMRFVPTGKYGQEAKSKSEIGVPIDAEFADAIHKAWQAMLLKARYPDKVPVYADASTAEFSAWVSGASGGAYGRAIPVSGFQKELTDFGFELKDYCTAKVGDRKTKRDSMIPRLKDFAERVEHSRLC